MGNIGGMDIATLSARADLSNRQIRYVLDHKILPGTRNASFGRGVPRGLADFEAFSVALAALLLDAGLKRKVVAAFFDLVSEQPKQKLKDNMCPLQQAFKAGKTSSMQIADGRFVRLAGTGNFRDNFDTGWRSLLDPRSVPAEADFLTMLQVDLAKLRHRITP